MKNSKIFLISVFLVMNTFTEVYSQSNFHFQIGTAIPLSNFYSSGIAFNEDDVVYGTPTIGIILGAKYTYLITDYGLGIYADMDFIYNGINKKYKEEMEYYFSIVGIDNYEFSKFINLPLSTGIYYEYIANEDVAIFGNLGPTVNFFKITDFVQSNNINQYNWSSKVGFKIGAGIIYKHLLSFQVEYLGLGKHKATAKDTSSQVLSWDEGKKINILTLSIGLNF
jgi:opacity protein-like surface antigen